MDISSSTAPLLLCRYYNASKQKSQIIFGIGFDKFLKMGISKSNMGCKKTLPQFPKFLPQIPCFFQAVIL